MEDEELNELGTQQEETPAAAPEPTSYAEAFRMLRKGNQVVPSGGVDAGEGQAEPGVEADGGAEEEGGEPYEEGSMPASDEAGGEPDGGSADDFAEFDLDAVGNGLVREMDGIAVQRTNKLFRDQGIDTYTIQDLYRKNERDGSVEFVNPDNERQPFKSRYEAQQWVNAFNQQVRDQYNRTLQEQKQQVYRESAPKIAMLQFYPTWQGMSAEEQEEFDAIVEGYELKDQRGNTIGYRCDLNRAAAMAKKNVARWNAKRPVQQQAPKKEEPTAPSTDFKTRGSNLVEEKKEPTNYSEAFKMLRAQKRGK